MTYPLCASDRSQETRQRRRRQQRSCQSRPPRPITALAIWRRGKLLKICKLL
ncbi:hypothetical protein [Nostoc sp.]